LSVRRIYSYGYTNNMGIDDYTLPSGLGAPSGAPFLWVFFIALYLLCVLRIIKPQKTRGVAL